MVSMRSFWPLVVVGKLLPVGCANTRPWGFKRTCASWLYDLQVCACFTLNTQNTGAPNCYLVGPELETKVFSSGKLCPCDGRNVTNSCGPEWLLLEETKGIAEITGWTSLSFSAIKRSLLCPLFKIATEARNWAVSSTTCLWLFGLGNMGTHLCPGERNIFHTWIGILKFFSKTTIPSCKLT